MDIIKLQWLSISEIGSKSFKCGFCGNLIASNQGYFASVKTSPTIHSQIYLCPHCKNPTYFDFKNNQFPGPIFGRDIENIPSQEVENLYNEARKCISLNCYTASVLCCRKLIMNIAVSKGAKENLKFIEYIEFLSNQGFVPPDGKDWVDHIRKKGNEATHEIKIMDKEDAEELLTFMEMLLIFIYEFPSKIKKKYKS